MARLRQNFQSGELSAGLTIGGTTLNSAELAAFQAVAGPDIAVIVLDPQGVDGAPEIVHVTAHTALAVTATILRAQEGTAARAHNAGTDWEHNITEDDFTYSNLSGLPVITAGVAVEDEGAAEGQADTIDFTGAGVSVTFAAGTATVDIPGGGAAGATANSQRTAGNVTMNSTVWANVDTATDLVIAAEEGDWIEVGLSFQTNAEAVNAAFDAQSLVAAATVNSWGSKGAVSDLNNGVIGWFAAASVATFGAGSVVKQVVAGDISGGNVTIRLRYRTLTAANKVLVAVATNPLDFWAHNLGQP